MAGPLVGIVLGSKSDLFVGKKVAETLVEVGVPFEITVASAHRTPEDAVAYAKKAASRGLKVLIGIAGLSAALPGVLAAHTSLPVIGVPVSSGTLGGNDALLAVTQMPPGVPVGAVGIDAGKNAAILAVRILALDDTSLAERLGSLNKAAVFKTREDRKEMEGLPVAPPEAF
ncbi:MAG: 5-(carboxyamino)imidazole ribonucleotide mutase [Synergistaceae bacterium]|nr:5-(carboxyamino)imidazole ribonucleotide mutase [Synergistaceae bacterium]